MAHQAETHSVGYDLEKGERRPKLHIDGKGDTMSDLHSATAMLQYSTRLPTGQQNQMLINSAFTA